LNMVFLEWMDRLRKCIDTNGDYVGWAKKPSEPSTSFIR
jgi:hypothetical protein